jgi:hypothetical protein
VVFRKGCFHFQEGVSPAEARLLAKALLEAAYDADLKNEWHTQALRDREEAASEVPA